MQTRGIFCPKTKLLSSEEGPRTMPSVVSHQLVVALTERGGINVLPEEEEYLLLKLRLGRLNVIFTSPNPQFGQAAWSECRSTLEICFVA